MSVHLVYGAGSPGFCVYACTQVGSGMKQLEEEGFSLVWVGAKVPDFVQQWMLHHLTPA